MEEIQRSLYASLEIVAERAGDITDAVYDRFFSVDPDAALAMEHSDEHMRGRMFQSVIETLLADDDEETAGYLAWEIENHRDAYAATAPMYASFLSCLKDVIRESMGDAWVPDVERAWVARMDSIIALVDQTMRPDR